jgi:hypothetical protein
MRTRAILVWVGLCIICFSTAIQAAEDSSRQATRYHNEEYGFSVVIPPGWEEAPEAMIQQAREGTRSLKPGNTPEILTQFVCMKNGRFAAIQIQAMRYPEGRQPSKRWMREFVGTTTGVDKETLKKKLDEVSDGALSERVRDIEILHEEFIPEEYRFTHTYSMTFPGIGKVHGWSVDHFGHVGVAGVSCYSLEPTFDSFEPQFRSILGSFRFDAGMEYQVVDWYASQTFAWVLIGGATAVLALVLRRK